MDMVWANELHADALRAMQASAARLRLPLLAVLLAACAPGGAPGSSAPDALAEASIDALDDAPWDASGDASNDAPDIAEVATSDGSLEAATDAAASSADVVSDSPVDLGPEAASDSGVVAGAGWSDPHTRLAVAASCGDCIRALAAGASASGLFVTGEFDGPLVDVTAPTNTRGVFIAHFDPASARIWLKLYGQVGSGVTPRLGAAETGADGATVLTRIDDGGGAALVELVLLDSSGRELWSVPLVSGVTAAEATVRAGVSITMNSSTIALLTNAPGGGGTLSTFARADGSARWSVSFTAADPHRPAPYWTTPYARLAIAIDDVGNFYAPSAGTPSPGGAAPVNRYDAATGAFVTSSDPSKCGISTSATNLFWVHLPGAAPFGCDGSFAASRQQLVGVGSAGGYVSDYGVVTVNFADVFQTAFPGSAGVGWGHTGALIHSTSSLATIAPDGTVYAMGTGLVIGPPDLDAVVFRQFLPDGTPSP
jgi:hypothetical protein